MTDTSIRAAEIQAKKEDLDRKEREFKHQKQKDIDELKMQHAKNVADSFAKGLTFGSGLFSGGSRDKHTKGGNHTSWYDQFPELMNNVGVLPTGVPKGTEETQLVKSVTQSTGAVSVDHRTSSVGVVGIDWIPTLPSSVYDSFDNIDVIATNVAAEIRKASSGSKNYNKSFVMFYLYAMASLYIAYAQTCRIYSLFLTAKSENWNYPEMYLAACGVSTNMTVNDIPQLRYYINNLAVILNRYSVPSGISIFDRYIWLATSIFKDGPIKKSCDYVFNCITGYALRDDTDFGLQYLEPIDISPSGKTLSEYVAQINTIINSITDRSDIYVLSGDIAKAFSKLYSVNSISDDFHIESVYDIDVLNQIHNATWIVHAGMAPSSAGYYYNINDLYIRETNEGKIYQGQILPGYDHTRAISGSGPAWTYPSSDDPKSNVNLVFSQDEQGSLIIDFQEDKVDPANVMKATRFTCPIAYNRVLNSETNQYSLTPYLIARGTEIINRVKLYYYDRSPNATTRVVNSVDVPFSVIANYNTTYDTSFKNVTLKSLGADWFPRRYTYARTYNTGTVSTWAREYVGDIANFTFASPQLLAKMHAVAGLSELYPRDKSMR